MKAIMLAAGVGARLGQGEDFVPKVLLEFEGRTLLERHVEILRHFGMRELVLGVGHQADLITEAIDALGEGGFVRTVMNPVYKRGPLTTLWALREEFTKREPVVFMDADVLYDYRLMDRLIASPRANCFLMDRNVRPGEDPVKLCFRDDRLVDFHKRPTELHDSHGEWIGFLKLSSEMAARVPDAVAPLLENTREELIYEEAFRTLIIADSVGDFDVEDITGLPWTEIDFVEDLERAKSEILPRLERLPR